MSTEATLSTITAARRDSSSTAWFWWKETRQLAPLVVLLIIVAMVIVLITLITDIAISSFRFPLPGEVTMLVFPGLFATGAGPLMVGQERSQRTLSWLALLPISARRLVTTKFFVALTGLAVMWIFAVTTIGLFHLSTPGSSHWAIGEHSTISGNPYSYPVWIAHSIFILLAGFYVAWRIENQFYSLVALIPLAFLPLILTGLVGIVIDRRMLTAELDWTNFGFTLLGILVFAPLTYRAAIRTLGPDDAPAVKPLLGVSPHSPAKETHDALAPRFGTQFAPIAWQSIHSARGTLAILVGMLLAGLLLVMQIFAFDGGLDWLAPHVAILTFLAISWLGVSVFKHDGSSERVRFLADRGVSPAKTYVALHAVPTAILCTALVLYGLWNLTISHRGNESSFSAGLPTLLTLLMLTVLVYGISQWVSQFVRALILSVILAPILSIIVTIWLFLRFRQWVYRFTLWHFAASHRCLQPL